jgi:hypothetical protein
MSATDPDFSRDLSYDSGRNHVKPALVAIVISAAFIAAVLIFARYLPAGGAPGPAAFHPVHPLCTNAA